MYLNLNTSFFHVLFLCNLFSLCNREMETFKDISVAVLYNSDSFNLVLQARITEMHFFLRSISDSDLLSLRRQGRLVWERYCSSVQSVVDTVVAVLRDRLSIPPLPIKDETSPSVFNSTFTVSLVTYLLCVC
jgi:hypothetical protein